MRNFATLTLLLLFMSMSITSFAQYITADSEVGCSLDSPPEITSDDSTSCIRVCSNQEIVFDANTSISQSNITWNAAGATVISTSGSTITVKWTNPGSASISVEVTTPNGIVSMIKCVEVLASPDASFAVLPNVLPSGVANSCTNIDVQFKDLSDPVGSSPIVAWNWDFGDGTYSNIPSPSHSYTQGGTFTVTLEVVNACNCRSTFTTEIDVISDEPVVIDCPAVACENEVTRYKGLGGCGVYDWTVVGGTFQAQNLGVETVDVVWDQVGPDGVAYLSASHSSCGRCNSPHTIKVPVVLGEGIIDGPEEICEGKSYLYRLPQWPATDYTWSISGSGVSIKPSDQPNEIIVTVADNPGQTATLRCVYDNQLINCGGKAILEIAVFESVSVNGPTEACENGSPVYTLSDGHVGTWRLFDNLGNVVNTGSGNTYTPTFPSDGKYIITVSGELFCSPEPFAIEVQPKPEKPLELNGPSTVCPNIPYTYLVSPSIPGTTLNWEVVGGTFSNGQTTSSGPEVSARFNNSGSYEIRAWRQYKKDLGCTSDTLVMAVTKENVIPDIVGPDTTCDNTYADYSSSYTNGELYEWKILPDARGTITNGNGTAFISVLWNSTSSIQTANLAVAIRKCGVTYHDTIAVTILPTSGIDINMPSTVCLNETFSMSLLQLGNTVINNYSSIDWDFGDGNSVNTTNQSVSHKYNNSSANSIRRTVTMTVNDPNGCDKTVSIKRDIIVKPIPVAEASVIGIEECEATATDTIYALVQNGIGSTASFQWHHNNTPIPLATSAKLFPPTYSLNHGSYYCVVSGSNGCADTTNIIIVDTTPCPNEGGDHGALQNCDECDTAHNHTTLNTTQLSGCGEYHAQATHNTPLIIAYEYWSAKPNNGITVTQTGNGGADFSFTKPGRYKLKYRVCHFVDVDSFPNEPLDTCSSIETMYLLVPYVAGIKHDVTCNSNGTYSVTFYDHSIRHPNATIDNYEFIINSNSVQNGSGTTYTTNLAPGNYTVDLVISGGNNQACSASINLNLPAMPVADFSFDFDGACQEYPIQFTNLSTPSSGLTYSWDFEDLSSSTVINPSRAFAASGNYEVSLIVQNALGCSDTLTKTVNVTSNQLTVNLNYSPDNIVCEGDSIILIANSTGFSTPDEYAFQPNEFAVVTNPDNSTSVFESGSYFVIARDANQCFSASPSSTVEFVPTPIAQIEGKEAYCLGDSIRLFGDLGVGTYNYTWTQNGNNVSSNPNISLYASTAGIHTFILYVSRNGTPSCWTTDTLEVEVFDLPIKPTLSFSLVNCQPYEIQISASSPTSGTYLWSDGQTGSVINVTEGGNFTATLTSAAGCSIEEVIYIPKSPEEYIWIYPLGCYEVCEEQVGDVPFDLPDPIISFAGWELRDPYNLVSWNSSGTNSIPDIWISPSFTGEYSFTLDNGFCDYSTSTFDLVLGDECPCDIEIEYRSSKTVTNGSLCQNLIDFTITNPYPVTVTISFTSANGVFVPNTVSIPPGSQLITLQFIPNPGFVASADQFKARISIPLSEEEFINCYKNEDYGLPQPLCNDTSWYKMGGIDVQIDNSPDSLLQTSPFHEFNIAPNPADEMVKIGYDLAEFTHSSTGVIRIYSVRGVLIQEIDINSAKGQHTIHTSDWSSGVYIVSLNVNEAVYGFRRLVIAR